MGGLLQQNADAAERRSELVGIVGRGVLELLEEGVDSGADFGELPDQIEPPVDETGLKLIPYEKEEMDKASELSAQVRDAMQASAERSFEEAPSGAAARQ